MPVLESATAARRSAPAQLTAVPPRALPGFTAIAPIKPRNVHFRSDVRQHDVRQVEEREPAAGLLPRGMDSLPIRSFDFVVALCALMVFLPLMVIIAAMIRGASPGPAIFRQQRVGRKGEMFPCLKFRTMVTDAQERLERLLAESEEARAEWARDQKLRNDPRVTPIGGFLRRTSLDELPQLVNVLLGQMSIVGPRPIVAGEIARYGTRFDQYCAVRPGLTGLWQISGRNDVSYGMRVRLDSLYVRRQSFTLNVAICFKTVPALLTSRGCY